MLTGYARVSTQDQNLDLQFEALTKAGCKKVFDDKISGSRAERPGLAKALEPAKLNQWTAEPLARYNQQTLNARDNPPAAREQASAPPANRPPSRDR